MPRKQKKHHYIYKTTCQVTGRFYIGMHSTDNLEDGYLGSGKVLGYSIAKHGKENHTKEILEHVITREALKLREAEIVNAELLSQPLNMNLKYGGEGGWDHKPGVSIEKQNFDRLSRSKKSLATRKLRMLDDEYRIVYLTKLSVANKGKKPWLGKKHTDEACQKMKDVLNKLGHQQAEKNSQFGSCWVTNGVKPVKIRKEELDEYLLNGYSRGRFIAA